MFPCDGKKPEITVQIDNADSHNKQNDNAVQKLQGFWIRNGTIEKTDRQGNEKNPMRSVNMAFDMAEQENEMQETFKHHRCEKNLNTPVTPISGES